MPTRAISNRWNLAESRKCGWVGEVIARKMDSGGGLPRMRRCPDAELRRAETGSDPHVCLAPPESFSIENDY
jgi:hypothetical protein